MLIKLTNSNFTTFDLADVSTNPIYLESNNISSIEPMIRKNQAGEYKCCRIVSKDCITFVMESIEEIEEMLNPNKSHVKWCVTFKDPDTSDEFINFEDYEEALRVYNNILASGDLITANLCKVIKTTE